MLLCARLRLHAPAPRPPAARRTGGSYARGPVILCCLLRARRSPCLPPPLHRQRPRPSAQPPAPSEWMAPQAPNNPRQARSKEEGRHHHDARRTTTTTQKRRRAFETDHRSPMMTDAPHQRPPVWKRRAPIPAQTAAVDSGPCAPSTAAVAISGRGGARRRGGQSGFGTKERRSSGCHHSLSPRL